MGTVPRDTYSIFIQEYGLPVELDDFYKEMSSELIKVMDKAELMPGILVVLICNLISEVPGIIHLLF